MTPANTPRKKLSFWGKVRKDLSINRYLYLMLIPVIAYYIIFHYYPLWGAQIAFKNFNFSKGVWGSPWVGFVNFEEFFSAFYFTRLLRNTVLLSVFNILWSFPAPIILALLLNEVRFNWFKRTVQTVTYLPHFISTVVICGLIIDFFSRGGIVNQLTSYFGFASKAFMVEPSYFRGIYIGSGIWQEIGWGSIIYLAALAGIDQELYEACRIDGAGKFRQLITVTLPGIAPTTIILLILRVGRLMNVGHEKVMLLYNTATYETADIISTFVYRKGLLEMDYSYSAAVGLFNSVINFMLIIAVNKISKSVSETSLW